MSGIFGFFRRKPDKELSAKDMHALEVWNRMYGRNAVDFFCTDEYGMGCHVEHLSEEYTAGLPVIRDNEEIAVIDAVLYNRDELVELFHIQKSLEISDEDLLLEIIKKHGYASLTQVNGDFAGAVYNEKKRTWTLFRDHMGVRPLFYYIDDTVFAFSTDMRGLLALSEADTGINEEQLYLHMMGYNDLSLCETEFARIHCVHPASYRVIAEREKGFSEKESIYWRLGQKKVRRKTDEDYFKELRFLVTDSIRRRMSAVPGVIGAELSGGVDSGVICILINRLGREGRYFSWSRPPKEHPLLDGEDERKIILDICRQEHISCEFSSKTANRTIEDYLGEIMPSYINTQSLSVGSAWMKSQGARVVFTGHGGDEGVSHRCNPFELWYHGEYLSFAGFFWDNTEGERLRLLRTIKRMLHQILRENSLYLQPYENKGINTRTFLNPKFRERMDGKVPLQPLYFAYDPAAYIEQGGPRVRLDNVAYHGAKNGVRYMIPFLDYRVIDFAVSIPRRLYLHKRMNRYIYRQAFRDIMPESLYKVRRKDSPSENGNQPQKKWRDNLLDEMNNVISKLDRVFWKDYLNFEEIDAFTLPEAFTLNDYVRAVFMLEDLMKCCFIQNEKDNAAKWCEEHE